MTDHEEEIVIPSITLRRHCVEMVHAILAALQPDKTLSWTELNSVIGTSDWIMLNLLQLLCQHELVGRNSNRSYRKARFWRLGTVPVLDWDSENVLLYARTCNREEFGVLELMQSMCWTFDDEEWATRKRKVAWRCIVLVAYNKLEMIERNAHRVYFYQPQTSSAAE